MAKPTFRERFERAGQTLCGCRYEDDYPAGRHLIPNGHPVHNGYFSINRYVFEDEEDRIYYQRVLAWRYRNKDPFGLPRKPRRYGWHAAFRSLLRAPEPSAALDSKSVPKRDST